MQKAFDFFMQIIQRLFKPELAKARGKKSFKIYASKDSTNKEVGIKNTENRMPSGCFETTKKAQKFLEQELVIN
jgi:hypothetical protein